MRQREQFSTTVLGSEAGSYIPLLNRFVGSLVDFRYKFLSIPEFEKALSTDISLAMQVYWCELLYRAHWAATSNLIRSQRWLSGILENYAQGNLLVFAACSRGFLEAAADTNDALNPVPQTLARHHKIISLALKGKLTERVVSQQLEDCLIHFTHARKARGGVELPQAHQCKTIKQYLEKLKAEEPAIADCYAHLCDIVHPSAGSVLSYTTTSEDGSEIILSQDLEQTALHEIHDELSQLFPVAIALGVGTGFLLLKTLNVFPLTSVHTPFMKKIRLDGMPAWERINDELKGEGIEGVSISQPE